MSMRTCVCMTVISKLKASEAKIKEWHYKDIHIENLILCSMEMVHYVIAEQLINFSVYAYE